MPGGAEAGASSATTWAEPYRNDARAGLAAGSRSLVPVSMMTTRPPVLPNHRRMSPGM